MSAIKRLLAIALFCLGTAAGSVSAAVAQSPQVSCEGLAGVQIPAARIGLPTGGASLTSAERMTPAAGPPYCRVEGAIHPVDPQAPDIGFAVAIPDDWNGGAWHLGGGGVNGVIPNLTTTGPVARVPGAPSLLEQGYATFGGDSGHQGRGTDWVRNDEAWLNFAYEQLKKTHDAAQAVLALFEGREAETNYFAGSSQGGREGLEVVARYPEDYDGVIVAVPLAYSQGLLIDPTVKMLTQAQPGAWIPPAKHPIIQVAVIGACDGLDGLDDGMISDPVGCGGRLDVPLAQSPMQVLRCPGGGDTGETCLSDPQLATLHSLQTSVRWPYALPNGKSDWPGWGPGSETALLSRTEPDRQAGAGNFGIGAGVQRQLFGGSEDYSLYEFDMTELRPRLEALSQELDVPPDWSRFFARGGKLIWVAGALDNISNPRAQMRLYDDVVAANGEAAVERAVRFYVLPMGDHGTGSRNAGGQAMPSVWNGVGALRDWVERDVAPPDAPEIARFEDGVIAATRPLCRYPAYPRYMGGDPTWAAAFACVGRSD
jgi:hypothetical protein